MAQKVQFITTVLHGPKLLILDEPFSGFDPSMPSSSARGLSVCGTRCHHHAQHAQHAQRGGDVRPSRRHRQGEGDAARE